MWSSDAAKGNHITQLQRQPQRGTTAEGKTYNVGVIQLVQHLALDAATEGFTEALKEKLGDQLE